MHVRMVFTDGGRVKGGDKTKGGYGVAFASICAPGAQVLSTERREQ